MEKYEEDESIQKRCKCFERVIVRIQMTLLDIYDMKFIKGGVKVKIYKSIHFLYLINELAVGADNY